ncbi:hypothetical protein IB655_00715 [Francisella noatunensis]|uniref:Uncharacterized protein n=1 Tax=Francisella noatunensis TaxID=657445 RepID=A0A9Q2KV50_9GAMM|nr:hypothetical protein [Francisella noatunensis]MBK2029364.1 hypothetical protein [Francisella noatunensis]MBK2033245.1 hypothetical protein [Francisella noatunensis]MBK2049372.1 hypothetical protein [Francisella noatunensis]MBK2050366.1 hypothetical protein [Francisella noatunensis]MBK2050990.1 hypothetical protein [Francisella noatunensis]
MNKLFESYQNEKLKGNARDSQNMHDNSNINPRKIYLFKKIIIVLSEFQDSTTLLTDEQISMIIVDYEILFKKNIKDQAVFSLLMYIV